jgi:hypothetical protein
MNIGFNCRTGFFGKEDWSLQVATDTKWW